MLVHTVESVVLVFFDIGGSADVGSDHALFDKHMSFIALILLKPLNLPLLIKEEMHLGRLELKSTASLSCFTQGFVEFMEGLYPWNALIMAFLDGSALGDHLMSFGVSKSSVRVHHGRVEVVAFDLTFLGDDHVAYHTQAVDIWIERADTVRQGLWQHRNHVEREVHAGATL